MYLIVGLGNPGKEYLNTRHNVGFRFIDKIREGLNKEYSVKFNGEYFENIIDGKKYIYLRPLSYMNLSGIVVKKFVDYFKIPMENMIIVYDDLMIPLGKYRIRYKGTSGGHNGIDNIIKNFQTENIKRIRVGISKEANDKISYVLGKFNNQEIIEIDKVLNKLITIVEEFSKVNEEEFISKYNDVRW